MAAPLPALLTATLALSVACANTERASEHEPIDAGVRDPLDASADPVEPGPPPDAGISRAIWRPAPGSSWQWQLTGELDTGFDVQVYDIDLFGTSAADIAQLKAQGRRVVCYFDTAYEPFRPDEARLRPHRGKAMGDWPGQAWLDVRAPAVVEVMKQRIALAAEKGCDAVEADDVDVATNDTGLGLSRRDQQTFIRTLAREAHAHGLAYGLKNTLEDVPTLVDEVEFAVNEQCFYYDECDALLPFIRAGKAVFHVEYPHDDESLERRAEDFCTDANRLGFDSLAKHLSLDRDRVACRAY